MATVNELAKALNDVHLGNIIEECVVTFEDDKAYITAMDLTSSIFVQTSAEIEHDDGQIGVSNLTLFVRYLNTIKDIDVTIKHKDDRMTLKPKSGGTVNYLLADVDLIPSFDDEWEENMVETELEKFESHMELKQNPVSEFLSIMGLFAPNSVFFEVSKKGIVSLHGGSETDHQFDVQLGKIKGVAPCSIKVYGKHLAPVLTAIDYNASPELYLMEGEAIIITTSSSSWILQPITDE